MRASPRSAAPPPAAGPVWRARGLTFRLAKPEDHDAVCALLSDHAMDSWVRLSLERDPGHSANELITGESRTVIARDDRDSTSPVGMYSCRRLAVHVNGRATSAGYLGELRVDLHHRHRIGVIRHGYASIPHLVPDSWQGLGWFTSIASDNHSARRLLEAGLPGMPRYTPLGEIDTVAFSTRRGRTCSAWQSAARRDVPALADFYNRRAAAWQFAPVLSESWLAGLNGGNGLRLSDFRLLKDGAAVRGCIAVWDQRGFKRTVVRGYRAPLNVLRAPYNFWARLTRRPELPAPGRALDAVFLAFAMLDPTDHAAALEGVRDALATAGRKGARLGLLGLSVANPLRAILKDALNGRGYRTCIESVVLCGERAPGLDGRPPQPEVAML